MPLGAPSGAVTGGSGSRGRLPRGKRRRGRRAVFRSGRDAGRHVRHRVGSAGRRCNGGSGQSCRARRSGHRGGAASPRGRHDAEAGQQLVGRAHGRPLGHARDRVCGPAAGSAGARRGEQGRARRAGWGCASSHRTGSAEPRAAQASYGQQEQRVREGSQGERERAHGDGRAGSPCCRGGSSVGRADGSQGGSRRVARPGSSAPARDRGCHATARGRRPCRCQPCPSCAGRARLRLQRPANVHAGLAQVAAARPPCGGQRRGVLALACIWPGDCVLGGRRRGGGGRAESAPGEADSPAGLRVPGPACPR
mmetsp:Transcript_21208/g.80981  ORF Transcript_21208/g.80981 Transcript_21208/m.80981 type:complete len:309 (-) Transcript_21208:1041-1967(-)